MVCDELDIPKYAMFAVPKKDMRIKDKADLLEAFIGALYVDKDLVKVLHFKYPPSLFFYWAEFSNCAQLGSEYWTSPVLK